MSARATVKGLNSLIGGWWACLGFLLFVGAGLWFLGLFFTDLFKAWFSNIPLPDDAADVFLIVMLWFLGGFFISWGGAMLNRREWGAWTGGLVRLVWTLYLIGAVALFYYRGVSYWFEDEALATFHQRYYWLFWAILGLWLLWLLSTTAWLFGKSRRDYYAEAYRTDPPPAVATCANCGLILREGACPECDKPRREAWLRIGKRRERLPFTKDEPAFIVGRQKDNNEAYLTISEKDTERPERISGRHALIQYHFDYKQFTVQDLATLNKTYLNDEPESLSPNKLYPLKHGDKINLAGEVTLIFEAGDETTGGYGEEI